MTWRFQPVLTLAFFLALAVLIGLGSWQLQRRAWKRDLLASVEARIAAEPIPFEAVAARAAAGEDVEYTPVLLRGAYSHDREALVFGSYEGAAGVYVFTPVELEGASEMFVYVNRGFAPQRARDAAARSDAAVQGPVEITGLFRSPERPRGVEAMFRSNVQGTDGLWHVRDPARFAASDGLSAPQWYIDSFGRENPASVPRGGVTRLEFPNRHMEYALTWFGLAGALAAVFLAFSMRRQD